MRILTQEQVDRLADVFGTTEADILCTAYLKERELVTAMMRAGNDFAAGRISAGKLAEVLGVEDKHAFKMMAGSFDENEFASCRLDLGRALHLAALHGATYPATWSANRDGHAWQEAERLAGVRSCACDKRIGELEAKVGRLLPDLR